MDSHLLLSLFHIFIVVPFFLYVALSRSNTQPMVYTAMLIVGIFILFYHMYKAVLKYTAGVSTWVNLIHILYIAPLMIYIGYKKTETPRSAYEILALVGFAALGYHVYHLILTANVLMTTPS